MSAHDDCIIAIHEAQARAARLNAKLLYIKTCLDTAKEALASNPLFIEVAKERIEFALAKINED
jgi:hypothetical protein